ncbi:MAG: YihY/virulence factor BrkB family protein [Candidatus Dormibacteraeota bacterium]|nr:YihY/virulence factor BrkB family protein [Candidatus Dormibacteraeota bacterium]
MGERRVKSIYPDDTPTTVTAPWLRAPHAVADERGPRAHDDHDRGRDKHREHEEHRKHDPFVLRVVKRYAAANGGTFAVNIAWNTLFAFFPIILLITTTLTAIVGGSGVSATVDANIESAIPGGQGQQIVQAVHDFHQAAGPLFVVSIVGLLWSGTALFSALEQGLDALISTKQRSFIRQKLMGVAIIAVFTLLVGLGVGSASLLSLVTHWSALPSWLRGGWIATLLQIGLGFVDGVLLFGTIYYIVPNRPQRVRDVVVGTLVAAVLFEAFMLLFPLFFKLQHGFSTYGQTFALFFLLLTFAFWLAQIVMLGAAVNAERAGAEGRAASSLSRSQSAGAR